VKSRTIWFKNRLKKNRAIESKDRRIVHFIFNPNQPVNMTPFTKKFVRYLDGTLAALEE
jgi:hypothetical protein